MRYSEFILEYRRDVTAQKMGDRLLQAFYRVERPSSIPDSLYGAWGVLDMVIRPNVHYDKTINLDVLGQMTTLNKDLAPKVLEQISPALINIILEQLEDGDPTPHKEYSQWIASRYITGDTKLEDIGSTLKEYLHKFVILKRKKMLTPPANDINRYNSFGNFMDVMDEYELPEDEVVNKGKSTEVYLDAKVRVIVPEDVNAAIYYGRGTRWCTAATRGSNYYSQYARQGPLYILIPSKPQYDGEKYQLHFPSEQFMNEQDDEVSLEYIINDRFDLVNFFKQQEPELQDYVVYIDEEQLEPVLKRIKEIAEEWVWDRVLDWEQHDEYWYEWKAERAREMGYVDDDGDIDWDRANDDDSSLNDYLEFNDELRRWCKEIEVALDYSAKNVKDFASGPRDGGDDTTYKMEQLDALIARIINYEVGRSPRDPDEVAEMIEKRIAVRRNTGRIRNTDPKWAVTVASSRYGR